MIAGPAWAWEPRRDRPRSQRAMARPAPRRRAVTPGMTIRAARSRPAARWSWSRDWAPSRGPRCPACT